MIRIPFGINRIEAGTAAELAAEQWLLRHGLSSVARNVRCKAGEIDLVMCDGEQLVFVEVRLRTRDDYGGAAASVTRSKQRRLIKAAQWFLAANPSWSNRPCRFDVVAADATLTWQWIRNAFYSE